MIAELKKRALHRVKILEGQIRGLEKAIENDDYCMDVITQSLAIQKSLGSLNKLMIENHARTHLAHHMQSKDQAKVDMAIEELLRIFEINNNRGSK